MKILISFLMFTIFNFYAHSQNIRVKSLGGMDLIILDDYNSLDLYDFGGNPAWLYKSKKMDWLKINPSFTNTWGDYRRLYDPARSAIYSASFDGIKTLGDDGTFRGFTEYNYERHKDIYRSLKRYPYAGESFFMTDTTSGNFRYNGPTVTFEYSYELFKDFFIGASVHYQVLDGLKDVYSRAKTLNREFSGVFGVAYQPFNFMAVGFSIHPFDAQERIESKSDDLLDVDIFNYRGDDYAYRKRGQTINQKIQYRGTVTGLQLAINPIELLNVVIRGDYLSAGKKILIPYGLLEEYEDGYSYFKNYSVELKANYQYGKNLLIGLSAKNYKNESWSKYTNLNLLLWEWNVTGTSVGLGTSYKAFDELLIGAEFEFGEISSDSSKYIDNKFTSRSSGYNKIKVGAEYPILKNLFTRAGYTYQNFGFDPVVGGNDIKVNGITFGLSYYASEILKFDLLTEYYNKYSKESSNFNRAFFQTQLSLTIFAF